MIDDLTKYWEDEYPGVTPIPPQFKELYPDRWVRFHSLPGSKRYPENEAEYKTMLDRHNIVINEIVGSNPVLFLVTTGYTETPAPSKTYQQLEELDPMAQHWQTIAMHEIDSDWEYPNYWHLFVSQWSWKKGILDPILRLIAQDTIANVTIIDTSQKWIYHPYDGGADIILRSTSAREKLKTRHGEWLPKHPSGL